MAAPKRFESMLEGYHLKQQLSRPTRGMLDGDILDVNEDVILIFLLSYLFHHLSNKRDGEGRHDQD